MTIIWNQSIVHCTFTKTSWMFLQFPTYMPDFNLNPTVAAPSRPASFRSARLRRRTLDGWLEPRVVQMDGLLRFMGIAALEMIYTNMILNLASFTSSALKSTTRPISSLVNWNYWTIEHLTCRYLQYRIFRYFQDQGNSNPFLLSSYFAKFLLSFDPFY